MTAHPPMRWAAPDGRPSLLDGLASTRTIRRYTDEPIPDEDMAELRADVVAQIEESFRTLTYAGQENVVLGLPEGAARRA